MTTKQTIDAFEERIKELLDEGYTAKEAVKIAYEEFPVMAALKDEVEKSLHKVAEKGYGGVLATGATDQAFKMVWAPDKLTLSDRTTRGAKSVRDMVASTLQQQMVRNANYKKNAMALFDGYGYGGIIPEQDIPKFMSDLIDLSNGPNYNKPQFRAALRSVQSQVSKLTTQGVKVAYNQLLSAIEARNDQALSEALYMATQERTRYFAERIARTERARAYIDGFLARWQNDDDCVAYQWKLSTAHPDHDICDLYAHADLYGLGKGVYPKEKVPSIPVHPHCMCRLKPIFKWQLPDAKPKERIEEGGREYIDTLSQRQKEQLLGVYGSREVEAGLSWTQKARAYNGVKLEGRLSMITTDDIMKIEAATDKALIIEGAEFIPKNTVVLPKKIIAGAGSDKGLRVADRLARDYGGTALQWSKLVGVIKSRKYLFDIHWYRHKDIGDFEFKIKSKKRRG